MSALDALAAELARGPGLLGKRDVAASVAALGVGGGSPIPVGDDCAAIPDGAGGWRLLACEGMIEDFVAAMPWFAGWSAVMANLSDIAAMGGRPTAVVNALWAEGAEQAAPILAGMRDACAAYGAPMVGGHANLRARSGQLSVAALGEAKALLSSFAARPGDALVLAVDLRGAYHDPHPFWDAATSAPPERLRAGLEILPEIAEAGLAHAAKDVSQGGIVGTAAMLIECSGVGCSIDLDALPRPPETRSDAELARWLSAFPSYGYLFAAAPKRVELLVANFEERGIAAARIGSIEAGARLVLRRGGAEAVVRDLAAEPLIGCGRPTAPVRELVDA